MLAGAPVPAMAQFIVGVTEAVQDLRLSLPTEGIVDRLAAKEGDWVEKGVLILGLDSHLDTLEAERRRLIVEDRAELDAVRVRRRTAGSIYDSTLALFRKSKAVSEEEVKKLWLELQEIDARERILEAQMARSEVEYQMALARLRQRELIAPISGVVTELKVNIGERAGSGEASIRLVDPRFCRLVINIGERWVRQFVVGQTLAFQVQVGDEWVDKSGTLVSASPITDPASHLVRVLIEFDNQDRQIRPGAAGRLRFPEGS